MRIKNEQQLRKTIRVWLILFIVFLVLSGLTAFPLETELKLLVDATTQGPEFIKQWLMSVYDAFSRLPGSADLSEAFHFTGS